MRKCGQVLSELARRTRRRSRRQDERYAPSETNFASVLDLLHEINALSAALVAEPHRRLQLRGKSVSPRPSDQAVWRSHLVARHHRARESGRHVRQSVAVARGDIENDSARGVACEVAVRRWLAAVTRASGAGLKYVP